ncbi:MAG: hypothetical protein J5902_06310 [Paludibacteraceae bacterium]|nr:hypothetical protein [Paludibacteraceae bacterium]
MKKIYLSLVTKKKLLLFVSAVTCCVAAAFAVPAPVNVHWDSDTLRWELPELTNDSAYAGIYLKLFTKSGDEIATLGSSVRTSYDFSSYFYKGRTYYAKVSASANPGEIYSADALSPEYTVPGVKDTLVVPDVALDNNGKVQWGYIGYLIVRATLQQKNGDEWTDIATRTTTNGWNRSISFDALTTPGTYRAVADALQGTDVVMRGISDELLIEETFTVSFNAQTLFENPEATVAPKRSQIALPAVPDQYKYQSAGNTRIFYWSTDAEGTAPWRFDEDSLMQDITLYAQWSECPALNPVWDGKICRWTMPETLLAATKSRVTAVYTENDYYIWGSGGEAIEDSIDYDSSHSLFFPGRKYSFSITVRDYYYNEVAFRSGLMTVEGEVAVLPLQNMQVGRASSAKVIWDKPIDLTYNRLCKLYQRNKTTLEWDQIATVKDPMVTWTNSYVEFNQPLDDQEYYRIVCQLYQGEYLIYEGELFYGKNPATGVSDIDAVPEAASKRILNGQLLIIRDGKTYNAQGLELK